ncbi:MAG: aminotransferase class III-fold pyridoxal phosphate-dependent enzyme, partial [Brevinematales bacterium]
AELVFSESIEDEVNEVIEAFLRRGILTLRAGENTLRLAPPLTISRKEIQIFLHAFQAILEEKRGEKR